MQISEGRMPSAARAMAAGLAMLMVVASTGDTPLGHSTFPQG